MRQDVEPLEAGVWLGQLRKLASRRYRGDEKLAAALRRGFHLAVLAPRPLQHLVGCGLSESEFEQLLEANALFSAALALLGGGLDYSLSHINEVGRVEAEVWFSSDCRGGVGGASSAPAAIFRAWLNCLCALESAAPGEMPLSPPIRRRWLSERRPRLTEH